MADLIVMQWLRPHLQQERLEVAAIRARVEEIRAFREGHLGCTLELFGVCNGCEAFWEYLDFLAEYECEIQEHVRGCAALMACRRDK